MKTILVKYWDPSELMDPPFPPESELIDICFTVSRYSSTYGALDSYANTRCTWSTLLDDSSNVQEFINEAWNHIKAQDIDWLEENFT